MAKKPKKKDVRQLQAKAQTGSPPSFAEAARPFPLWAKLLIAFVIVGQIGLLTFFCSAMIGMVDLLKQSVDPVYVKERARLIVELPDPLPKGFEYRMGFAVTSSGVVSIVYQPDQTEFMIGAPPEQDLTSARQRVDNFIENGIPNVTGTLKVEEKSTLDVGGKTFEFTRATAGDGGKNSTAVFIACTVLPNRRSILLFGRTPGSKFNQTAATVLFNSISKFNVPDGSDAAQKAGTTGNLTKNLDAPATTTGKAE